MQYATGLHKALQPKVLGSHLRACVPAACKRCLLSGSHCSLCRQWALLPSRLAPGHRRAPLLALGPGEGSKQPQF